MFLDASNSLILKPMGNSANVYTRVGVANFLRTQSQREAAPIISKFDGLQFVPFGPMSDIDQDLVLVTII